MDSGSTTPVEINLLRTTIDDFALHVDQGAQVDAIDTAWIFKAFNMVPRNAYLQNLHTMVFKGHY